MTGFVTLILTLLLVLGLAIGAIWLLRFAQTRGLMPALQANPLRVTAKVGLGLGASLVRVESEGGSLLLGVTRGRIELIEARRD